MITYKIAKKVTYSIVKFQEDGKLFSISSPVSSVDKIEDAEKIINALILAEGGTYEERDIES